MATVNMDLNHHQTPPSSTAMNFTENQQGSTILDKLRIQKECGRFCDVVFHVKDREYLAHRNVLAACSPYFDSMLKTNKVAKEHLSVSCKSHEVFEILLNYVYTGKVVIDRNTVYELLRIANYFLITKLKAYCSEYLERNLDVSNCFSVKDQAEKCGLPSLAKSADIFIQANVLEILQHDEILEFPLPRMECFLSNKQGFTIAEEMKLHLISRWLTFEAGRLLHLKQLLGFIQWSNVNIQLVYQIIQTDNLFLENENCLQTFLEVLEQQGLLIGEYQNTLAHLRAKQSEPKVESQNLLQLAVSTAIGIYDEQLPVEGETPVVNKEMDTAGPHDSALAESSKPQVNDNTNHRLETGETKALMINEAASIVTPEFATIGSQIKESDDDMDGTGDNADPTLLELTHNSNIGDMQENETVKVENLGLNVANNARLSPVKRRRARPARRRIVRAKSQVPGVMIQKRKRGRPPKKQTAVYTPKKRPRVPVVPKTENQDDLVEEEDDNKEWFHADKDPDAEIQSDSEDDDLSESGGDSPSQREKYKRRKKGQGGKIKCSRCLYMAKSPAKLDKHMNKAHRYNTTYMCPLCDYQCAWNREFYVHMKTHFKGPPFKCDNESCDYTAERIQPLLNHRMIHTDERPYECTICNFKFRTKNNLTAHLRCHTGEKPFKCPVCERCFATKSTLEQHSVTHSDARPFLCDMCGFSTKYQSHLISHKRIHSGDVFRCQFPNCVYSTPKRSQLNAHMRTHMSIRSHVCTVCGRGFVEKSHLVRHERIHLEDKPFKCDKCDYGSTRRDKLKEHISKHHGENATAKAPYMPHKSRKGPREPTFSYVTPVSQVQVQPTEPIMDTQPSTIDARTASLIMAQAVGATVVQAPPAPTATPVDHNSVVITSGGEVHANNSQQQQQHQQPIQYQQHTSDMTGFSAFMALF